MSVLSEKALLDGIADLFREGDEKSREDQRRQASSAAAMLLATARSFATATPKGGDDA